MKSVMDSFLEMLEQERFYDAHETLESLWFPRRFDDSDEVRLLKGLINAAVSFELKKRGRIKQSKKVWGNYLKYRKLLYKIQSPYFNEYHRAVYKVDKLYSKGVKQAR